MRRTILVVDDSDVSRGALCAMLGDEYDILEAKDGKEALHTLHRTYKYLSAMLLGLVMPEPDGFQVLEQMQGNAMLAQIPVIAITGQDQGDGEMRALALGANDFITKPYNEAAVKRRLRNIIKLRETSSIVNTLQRDKLTGLLNRESFLGRAWDMVISQPPGYYVMSFFDIDKFKVINDQYGNEKGDQVLRSLAVVLREGLRELGGIACRIAGDDFATLYPSSCLGTPELERILQAAARPDEDLPPITFSVGRYLIDDLSIPPSAMLDRAALAAASIKGRYDVFVANYDESMRRRLLEEQSMVNEMREALATGQFEAWYQPLYNHNSGAMIGAEALARWRRPGRGLLISEEFIPVFERNGFICELDKYIWEQACRFLRSWLDQGRPPLPVAVNVSRSDILQPDIAEVLLGLVSSYDLSPELLRLEMTENTILEPDPHILSVLQRLTDLGFTLEIDDFGSGCASLNTLKDVPAAGLKLDMSFLDGDELSHRAGNILGSVVRMAKWLNMSVTAKGVETLEQADYLRSIGCSYVQGFLYSPPLPAAEYLTLAQSAELENRRQVMETVENLDNNAFWDPNSMDTLIFNSYIGGACIFEYHQGQVELLRVNEKYTRELLGPEGSTETAMGLMVADYMDQRSQEEMLANIERAIETGEESVCEARLSDLPGHMGRTIYLRVTVRVIARAGQRRLLYGTIVNITPQREAELQISSLNENLQKLMNDTPGGFARLRVGPEGALSTDYVNENLCRLRGLTNEEILAAEGENALAAIHPDDVELVQSTVKEMMDTGETRSIQYRMRHGDGHYIPFTVFGRVTGNEAGEIFINAYFATLSVQEEQELTMRETIPYLLSAIMEYSTDLVFAKDKDFRYLCCSPAFVKFTRQKSEADVIGKTDYDFWTLEEANHFRGDDEKLFREGKPLIDYIEPIPSDDGIQHYCSTSKYLLRDATGAVIGMYGIGRDVTEYRTTFERLKLLTDSIPGGLATYAMSPNGVRLTYFNDGLCQMLGYTREEYEAATKDNFFTLVFEEDMPLLMSQVEAMVKEQTPINCTYRVYKAHGDGYKWLNLRVAKAERQGDELFANAVLYDVTEQKAAEEAARVHEQEMRMAMSQIGKMICEYDPVTQTLTMPESYAQLYQIPRVLVGVPENDGHQRSVDPRFHEDYARFYRSILRGEQTGVMEYRTQQADESWHWERAEFSAIFDSTGQPIKAIIAIEDTTEQHLRYELEQSRPSLGEENLLIHGLFNLTTGQVLDYTNRDGSLVQPEDRTAFTYSTKNLDDVVINAEEREQYRILNDRETLLERYAKGETELTLDYRRRMPDGETIWVRNILRMVRQPGGSDILLFEYCYNIEEEKTQELMYNALVGQNYDFVARVNAKTHRFLIIANAGVPYGMPPQRGQDLDQVARDIAERFIHPEDREETIRNTTIAGMIENLAQQDRFQFTCRIVRPDGVIRYKKLTYYYLDRERDIIILSREDVSSAVQAEMHKNELLADALEAANQASLAKTQFLSRMSHELRTPMNAIIGLAALAAGEVNNPRAMEDAISKIGLSARYLLSLINDILEMSRIESGRVTLNEAPFDFEQLIADVNTIIYPQAAAKGLDYDVIINSYLEATYVGDVTKLQEILVNILGNAVKFTPSGGKLTLTIEQVRCIGQRATMRFIISDTGCGIEPEFLPRLFEPFAQEGNSAASGTGLGLAITKNLAELMNGQISVESIKNVGSVFTVEVQLDITSQSQHYQEIVAAMNLSQMRALVVDDDVLVCQSTESILKAIGMHAEWVDSGPQAVERVRTVNAEKKDFDAIFIDWKMPDMDGIETTRQIRKIVGPEVTIIIITAYDWSGIEDQAREAGVDMFMEKPLFQSSVVKAFERVFLTHQSKIDAAPAQPPDLSGVRILLAEDHPLNVEVAKRLLERVGAEVEVASNGLEAMETYTTAAEGWFDAILMDVQMPVMDGLTAARNIRKLKKSGSKDIPIIAMTANAFDEDVEKSMHSGMDAHLAKPVEPHVLYATLKRLINR